MITLKDWLEVVDYRISEGSVYGWTCFGPNAHRLDAWNGDPEGTNASVVFDTQNQTVYEATVYDYAKPRAFRMINPNYVTQYKAEAKKQNVNPDQAWDDVNYIDLDVEDDFLDKARAIMSNQPYDDRVKMPLVMPDEDLFELMKMAHEYDMSLNQFVEQALKTYIDVKGSAKSKPAVITANNKKRKRKQAV